MNGRDHYGNLAPDPPATYGPTLGDFLDERDVCRDCGHHIDAHDRRAEDGCAGCDECIAARHAAPAVVWCRHCPEPATGDDELCDPHRAGVPAAITDPWLAKNYAMQMRRPRPYRRHRRTSR